MKHRFFRAALQAVPFIFLAGCSVMPQAATSQSSVGAYVMDADDIVKAADWKKMETVTVMMEEHSYGPQNIVFKVGQPYKLELKNIGDKDHYYTAPEFLRSIATRKAMVNKQAEIKAPYFKAFEVLKKGGQLDVYFIPVVKGQYKVYCTIDDHREKGMDGVLTIE
jgi:uncharacterized cupredoxin-like copper-binding protein